MSDPTPREALTRLVRSLMASSRPTPWPTSIDTAEGLESMLDTDEAADYTAVADALFRRPRFAYAYTYDGSDSPGQYRVFDLGGCDVHNDPKASQVAWLHTTSANVTALVRLLNDHPDEWDRFREEQAEPF